MPLTPLHTLSLLWIYLRYPRLVDPAALIVSTSIIDLESAAAYGMVFVATASGSIYAFY